MTRLITARLFIDWDLDGDYDNETARLVAANGSMRLAAPESGITSPRGTVDQATLTLNNHNRWYSPLNTAGPLYGAIGGGGAYHAPMYLEVSINGGGDYFRVFTGVIKIPREDPPYPSHAATVEIDCRSRDETLLSKRMSTPLSTFVALHEANATEADIIAQWLEDAGLTSGDYTLDPGLFVIPWAWLDDESPIEDIWQLAAACGGRFYVDPDGEFRYENMAHWLMSPHDTSQETLDKGDYGQLDGPAYDDRELFNAVTVIASPREPLESGVLWQADEIITVPANSTVTRTAKLRQPATQIDSIDYDAMTSGGIEISGDVTITATYFAQRVELSITNANTLNAANLISLEITGVPISGGPTLEAKEVSVNAFWTGFATARPGRVKLVQGNNYLQTSIQAGVLAEFLRDRFELPRLSWRLRNTPGVPDRRLGDRITTENADVMSSGRDGFLVGLNWRLGDFGFVQDLEIVDATGLYPFGDAGEDGYFVIGTSTLGNNLISTDAHLFY